MTFTPRSSLAANISPDCEKPRIRGYESIGLIFRKKDIVTFMMDAQNDCIIKSLTFPSSGQPLTPVKCVGIIYNPRHSPTHFNGTGVEFNIDTDCYKKTVQFYFDNTSTYNVIEPLKDVNDYVIILERKDKRGDGSFVVVGWESELTATAQVYDEETSYWLITMETEEPDAEITLFDTDYETTKTLFEGLKAHCYD